MGYVFQWHRDDEPLEWSEADVDGILRGLLSDQQPDYLELVDDDTGLRFDALEDGVRVLWRTRDGARVTVVELRPPRESRDDVFGPENAELLGELCRRIVDGEEPPASWRTGPTRTWTALEARVPLRVHVTEEGGRQWATFEFAGRQYDGIGAVRREALLELVLQTIEGEVLGTVEGCDPEDVHEACAELGVELVGDHTYPEDWWLFDPRLHVTLQVLEE